MNTHFSNFRGLLVGLATTVLLMPAQAAEPWTYSVEVWDPPFNMESPRKTIDYTPVVKASQPWSICVSFPHMKDAYWLGVNYGVVSESQRAGVRMQLVEAGGYTELNTQISQIEDCVAGGADAVVIGAISNDGLNNLVGEIRDKGIPVIDVINGMSSPELSAKSLVSFGEMGAKTGEFLAKKTSQWQKVKVACSPDRRVRAGWRPATPDSPKPSKQAQLTWWPPNMATPAKKCSPNLWKMCWKHIPIWITSPAQQ